ncbi:hypothetical protein [Streptomyces sp. SGAir0957]
MADPTMAHPAAPAAELLAVAGPLYTAFTGHGGDRSLSESVVEVLAPAVGDLGVDAYGVRLGAFVERYRERLARNYADYGPHSAHHVPRGRYVLARQPESLIVWELLSGVRGRFALRAAWQDSELPGSWLEDMADVWGVAL